MKETWKPVPFKHLDKLYLVSSLGRVKSYAPAKGKENPRIMTLTVRGEYIQIDLVDASHAVRKRVAVHRLVCLTFHGPPPIGKTLVRHLNDSSLDNRASNLSWGSYAENGRDRVTNHHKRGDISGANAKLDVKTACSLAKDLRKGFSKKKLMDKYKVSSGIISRFSAGISYPSLPR